MHLNHHRTSPYSFAGLEEKGLQYMAEAREKTGLKIVSEVMDPRSVPLVAEYCDIVQIGARNMQNFNLLREVGKIAITCNSPPPMVRSSISITVSSG